MSRSLEESFSATVPWFQDQIKSLADTNNKNAMTVFGWWKEYCRDCSAYDQSPIFSEFTEWYAKQLKA